MANAETKILSARRAYEFLRDDIRLTVLTQPPLVEQVRALFGFQAHQVATPPALFGSAGATLPPGLVFNLGQAPTVDPDLSPATITRLHVEATRVVIEVAGPSASIEPVYRALREAVGTVRAADGTPVLGEPVRVLDYSEVTRHLPVSADAVLAPQLRPLFRATLGELATDADASVVPSLRVQALSPRTSFEGSAVVDAGTFVLELRAGVPIGQSLYFSGAPLDTDAHLAYLDRLVSAVVGEPSRPSPEGAGP